MIFGAFIALLKGSEPAAVKSGSNMNESQFINTTVEVNEEKSGFTYVSTACKGQLNSNCPFGFFKLTKKPTKRISALDFEKGSNQKNSVGESK